jgi:hypothetical protein
MNLRIEIMLENNEKLSAFLHKKIREFNNEHSVYHKEARKKNLYSQQILLCQMTMKIGLVV